MADIDEVQNNTNKVLQDTTTGISAVDVLIQQALTTIMHLCFGTKDQGPSLLMPTRAPLYMTSAVLRDMIKPRSSVGKGFSAAALDAAWQTVREYAAQVATSRKICKEIICL